MKTNNGERYATNQDGPHGALEAHEIDGETLLLSSKTDRFYGLDDVSTRVWGQLREPVVVETLCARLVSDFAVDVDTCHRDVLAFLQQLFKAGLVKPVD